jgi:hypothetical protein
LIELEKSQYGSGMSLKGGESANAVVNLGKAKKILAQ